MTKGTITLATGPMFSGKTEWLIDQLNNFEDTKLAIRFSKDTRYSKNEIASHNGKKISAKNAANISDIKALIVRQEFDTIGIDEIQFFEEDLSTLLQDLKSYNKTIFLAGLDMDFRAEKWETTQKVEQIADSVLTFQAICSICKQKNAIYSSRKEVRDERVVIGGTELYEPRCEEHFEI